MTCQNDSPVDTLIGIPKLAQKLGVGRKTMARRLHRLNADLLARGRPPVLRRVGRLWLVSMEALALEWKTDDHSQDEDRLSMLDRRVGNFEVALAALRNAHRSERKKNVARWKAQSKANLAMAAAIEALREVGE